MNSEKDGHEDRQPGQADVRKPVMPVSAMPWIERRATPRFKCLGSAQLRREDGNFYTWGAITDISLQGCHLEMPSVFATGTPVFLQIELVSFRLILKGEVRVSSPSLGMGIAFRELTSEDREELAEIIRIVATGSGSQPQETSKEGRPGKMPKVNDPARVLDILWEFFQVRNALTGSEFAQILGTFGTPSGTSAESSEQTGGQKDSGSKAMARGSGA